MFISNYNKTYSAQQPAGGGAGRKASWPSGAWLQFWLSISHCVTWGSHWCLWDSFLFSTKQRFWLADRQSPTRTDVLFHAQHCLGDEETEGTKSGAQVPDSVNILLQQPAQGGECQSQPENTAHPSHSSRASPPPHSRLVLQFALPLTCTCHVRKAMWSRSSGHPILVLVCKSLRFLL